MLRKNFMQEQTAEIGNYIAERVAAPLKEKTLKYRYDHVPNDFGNKRGPGLQVKFVFDHDSGTCTAAYPIAEYADMETLKKAIQFDLFFLNITMQHPKLNVVSCDFALDVVRVYVGSRIIDVSNFRRFYDVDACVLHVDKFIQAVNERLLELCPEAPAKKHGGLFSAVKKRPVFSPGYTGEPNIKAPFAVEAPALKM